MKYTFILTERQLMPNGQVSAEYISDGNLRLYDSQEKAYNASCEYAEELSNDLSYDCTVEGRHFGIPEDSEYEKMKEVKVVCYDEESESQCVVARYTIKKII